MLSLVNVGVKFHPNTQFEREILHQLNLEVSAGEFIVIIGGNGSGKSTLFNVIAGEILPHSGKVFIDGQDVSRKDALSRSKDIARVVQDTRAGTMPDRSLYENLAFAFMRGKRRLWVPYDTRKRRQFFREKLAMLGMGLEDRMDDKISSFSGGQRQAASLIMSVLSPSKILLLDEITAALDPKIANVVVEIANRVVRAEGKTTLMITHNMQHAIDYGDRLLVLSNGAFVKEFIGATKELLSPNDLAQLFV